MLDKNTKNGQKACCQIVVKGCFSLPYFNHLHCMNITHIVVLAHIQKKISKSEGDLYGYYIFEF